MEWAGGQVMYPFSKSSKGTLYQVGGYRKRTVEQMNGFGTTHFDVTMRRMTIEILNVPMRSDGL